MKKIYYVVPAAALAFGLAFSAFAVDEYGKKGAKPGPGPIKAFEHALERLEKVENFEFGKHAFEVGTVPATLSINPVGKIRITNGKVTAVASDRVTVEIWKLVFTVHRMPDTKVFAGKETELAFGDIAVGDTVDVLGRLDADQTAFVHAEIIHDRARVMQDREREILRLRGLIEDLIRRLQEILARQGGSLPPGISPLPSPTPTPIPTPTPTPTPTY